MRVREMANYISQVNFEECELTLSSATIGNIQAYKEAIPFLQYIPIFKKDIQEILEDDLYSTTQDTISFGTTSRAFNVYTDAMRLLNKASLLLDLSNEIHPPLSENTISIKLPENYDLKALNHSIRNFEKALSFLVTDETINSKLVVENWEHGSFWLNLCVDSMAAISVISYAAWSAAVIAKKYQEVKMHEQHVKSLELGNETVEILVEAQKKLIDQLVDNETKSLIDKHMNSSTDHEKYERVKSSITMLAELIREGSEINPSLSAPEEVKNLFPDFSKLEQITSQIPQIEHK